jgi:hypothetical protein
MDAVRNYPIEVQLDVAVLNSEQLDLIMEGLAAYNPSVGGTGGRFTVSLFVPAHALQWAVFSAMTLVDSTLQCAGVARAAITGVHGCGEVAEPSPPGALPTGDDVWTLAVHPALTTALTSWLDSRGQELGRIPDTAEGEPVWIVTPSDRLIARSAEGPTPPAGGHLL